MRKKIIGIRCFTWSILLVLLATTQILLLSKADALAQKGKVKICIGSIPHMTGAYAAGQVGVNEAFFDTIKWANENNYIPGVELITTWADGGTDVGKSTAAFKKMIAETPRPVAILGHSTAVAIALKSWNLKEMIPLIEGGSSVDFFQLPSATFSTPPPYVNQAGAWVDYFMQKIWKEKRPPRFAWLTWDNPFGRAPITPEVEAYIKSKGIEIVGAEFIPPVPTDSTPQLLRSKNNKVDMVHGAMYHNALSVVLKDASKLGILGQFTIGMNFAITLPLLIEQAGPLANGIWQVSNFILEDELAAKAPRVLEIYEKNQRTTVKFLYMYSVRETAIAIEAVKMAVEAVGAEKVDGKAVYDALCRMKNFDNWGLGPATTFSETRRYGQDQLIVYHIEDQKIKTVDKIPAPDITPGGKDVPK